MSFKKSLVSLALCAILVLTSMMGVFASDVIDSDEHLPEEEVIIITDPIAPPLTRANYLVIDNEAIYTSDKSWDQPTGYISYRVSITNTSSQTLSFTVKYGSSSYSDTVAANKTHTFVVNNAQIVKHTISFSSSNGSVSGTVSVRVSDTAVTVN